MRMLWRILNSQTPEPSRLAMGAHSSLLEDSGPFLSDDSAKDLAEASDTKQCFFLQDLPTANRLIRVKFWHRYAMPAKGGKMLQESI